MDRRAWLAERRAAVEHDYTRDAPDYDTGLYPISETHRAFVTRVIEACPPDGIVLDVPCGTGRYFELVVAQGRRVVGADQSAGMVEQARSRGLAERVEETGLQELAYVDAFDGVLCIDAMEHVPPEDWPLVVGNLGRALRPAGFLYMTLEVLADQQAHLERALADALVRGLPAVAGEDVGEDTGGYHFYPSDWQIGEWLGAAALEIAQDVIDMSYGDWGYRHLLLRHQHAGMPYSLAAGFPHPATIGAIRGRGSCDIRSWRSRWPPDWSAHARPRPRHPPLRRPPQARLRAWPALPLPTGSRPRSRSKDRQTGRLSPSTRSGSWRRTCHSSMRRPRRT
jgi:SAM-dependent methyltransferase